MRCQATSNFSGAKFREPRCLARAKIATKIIRYYVAQMYEWGNMVRMAKVYPIIYPIYILYILYILGDLESQCDILRVECDSLRVECDILRV